MALVVQQADLLLVQEILDKVSLDLRYQLSSTTSPDQDILLDYCDRVQKELFLTSRFEFLLSPVWTFTTVVGQTDYYIGVDGCPPGAVNTGLSLPNIQSIKRSSVNDLTNDRNLSAIREKPLSSIVSQNQQPRFFRSDPATPDLINIYPPPDGAYQIAFRFYNAEIDLTDVGQLVQVPKKYKHVLIAGIDEMGFAYLKKADETGYWQDRYAKGKVSIIRDQNLFPRGAEFVSPDPQTQYRNQFGDDFFTLLWNK